MIARPQELLALAATVLVVTLFVAPMIGIQRAARRLRAKARSNAAIVMASCAAGLSLAALLGGVVSVLFGVLACALNLAWLWSSISANRRAARTAASGSSPPERATS